ncbi:MAG: amino acid permease, partial [Burkholderiales bacterium]
TYGGWNEAAYISAELKQPARNMVRSLVLSIALVTALYLLVNLAYLRGLGLAGMGRSQAVAADLLGRTWGDFGTRLISVLIAVSTLTSINATMIVGARSNYALGGEWRLFAFLARWDAAAGTPRNALLFQCAIALGLIGLGAVTRKGFETLVDYTAPVFWAFFLLVGVALFVLRRREAGVARPFRVPLYPLTPAIFVATCAYLLYSSLAYTGVGAWVGVGVIAAGGIVLLVAQATARR